MRRPVHIKGSSCLTEAYCCSQLGQILEIVPFLSRGSLSHSFNMRFLLRLAIAAKLASASIPAWKAPGPNDGEKKALR